MKCDCGHNLASNRHKSMQCRCGRTHQVQPVRTLPRSLSGCLRGTALFSGKNFCRCSDAAALLDRWGPEKSIDNAEQIATLLKVSAGELVREIRRVEKSVDFSGPIDLSRYVATGPVRDDVRLITFHFNPMRYERQRQTYYEWLPSLGPLAELLQCYELVFDDDPPEIEGSTVIRGTRSANLMFQKEALINIGLRQTPPGVRYFGWLDHDIVIERPDWLAAAIAGIDAGASAVQCWSTLQMLDLDRLPLGRKIGAASHNGKGAPGGAWLADRAYLDSIGGLHPYHITGGGDVAFYSTVSNHHAKYLRTTSHRYWKQTETWIDQARAVGGNCGHVESHAFHLFHGTLKNRQYQSRSKILAGDFNPLADLRFNADGLLEWASEKPELHKSVRDYFSGRREDTP